MLKFTFAMDTDGNKIVKVASKGKRGFSAIFYIFIGGPLLIWAALNPAHGSELIINVTSYHINSVVDFNEQNYGLGYRNDSDIEIGFFRNSYYHTTSELSRGNGYSSYIKGSVYKLNMSQSLTFNIDAGLAHYGNDGITPAMPIIHLMAYYSITNDIKATVGYVPMFIKSFTRNEVGEIINTSTMHGLLTLSINYSF